jgi:hypothetical protein
MTALYPWHDWARDRFDNFPARYRNDMPKFAREETQLKILRFNDDRIGVIKDGNMVVDVSDSVSARKAKGPQRVMEEIIEGWRKYRRRFEKIMAEQSGVPLDSVQLRCPCRGRASASPPSAIISIGPSGPRTIFPTNISTNLPIWWDRTARSSCATFLPA